MVNLMPSSSAQALLGRSQALPAQSKSSTRRFDVFWSNRKAQSSAAARPVATRSKASVSHNLSRRTASLISPTKSSRLQIARLSPRFANWRRLKACSAEAHPAQQQQQPTASPNNSDQASASSQSFPTAQSVI